MTLPIQETIFSPCKTYRYTLYKKLNKDKITNNKDVLFIGLNPSVEDEMFRGMLTKRCVTFAEDWNYSGIYMLNLFAYRISSPKQLVKYPEPIGSDNDKYLLHIANDINVDKIIAIWGIRGNHLNRNVEVKNLLSHKPIYHLGLTPDGYPRHPAFLKLTEEPTLWE